MAFESRTGPCKVKSQRLCDGHYRACGVLGLCTEGERPSLLVLPQGKVSAHLCDVWSLIFSVRRPCCTVEHHGVVTAKRSFSFPPFSC